MRQAVRQSTRLTRCQRLAQSSRSRTASPVVNQRRCFHGSTYCLTEPRPPNRSSEQERHLREQEQRRAQQPKSDDVDAEAEQQKEEEQRRLQAGEARPTGSKRKTLRQRRQSDIPPPPPIPAWFMRHNVRLEAEQRGIGPHPNASSLIRCVDAETGHTLFTVPWYGAWPDRGHGGSSANGLEEAASVDAQRAAQSERTRGRHSLDKSESSLGNNFFGFRFKGGEPGPEQTAPALEAVGAQHHPKLEALEEEDDGKTTLQPIELPSDQSDYDSKYNPLKWTFLEIEASARASMSMASQLRNLSFAASRADLSLLCPDSSAHAGMDMIVHDLASILQADIVRLDANDLAELTGDYVGSGHDSPGSFASLGYDVFDGYQANNSVNLAKIHDRHGPFPDEAEQDEQDEEEEEQEDEHSHNPDAGLNTGFGSIGDLRKVLEAKKHELAKVLGGIPIAIGIGQNNPLKRRSDPARPMGGSISSDSVQWDDMRLGALLDGLLDAPAIKRANFELSATNAIHGNNGEPLYHPKSYDKAKADLEKGGEQFHVVGNYQEILRYWRRERGYWLPSIADMLVGYCQDGSYKGSESIRADVRGQPALRFEAIATQRNSTDLEQAAVPNPKPRLIVHVRDLQDICNAQLGDAIVKRLVRTVQKRRRSGQEILIIGTSARDFSGSAADMTEHEDSPFRSIILPPFFRFDSAQWDEYAEAVLSPPKSSLTDPADARILEINLRHIQSMLSRLLPNTVEDMRGPDVQRKICLPGTSILGEKVLSLNQVQRLVLTAIGLADQHARAAFIKPVHVAMATNLLARADHAVQSYQNFKERAALKQFSSDLTPFEIGATADSQITEKNAGKARLDRIRKSCNPHETRLLSGVVDPANIKTAFADVHAPPETIDALRMLTTLSLLRPDAFKYGVLANDRLPGLLLYGPPGTGKTLLAKAVAKESKATVLEISGAQIYEKYVGEGEKMVRAVFSLSKKLSPCVVFIDEADAIFGSRSGGSGNRNTHREIINQFLREWDGMEDHSVFMMVATNRPFDLDDAVLRRLPRRLLVDLPTPKDREGILGIHLKGEEVATEVELAKLAVRTPMYSGSDLKNLCVAAALAAVREENDMAAASAKDTSRADPFVLPAKRVLGQRHFDKALMEISASISEDMSSLTAIRKFDEQYGDRKGRRKKAQFGIGGSPDGIVDESAVRVRQGEQQPRP